ncbi:glycosyltransferase family 4 protein [Chitinolyticbacter albus]|uniref:glycosyltransferase family 4 protein n=1 Tax=Chitinolyticbacter albus TaxID=2961951 RepID=UPI002109E862|nr:glycosyltransferase family 4 protein [Chitinolyticbacter albus]
MTRLAIVRQKYNPHGGAERFVSRTLNTLVDAGELDVTLIAREWQDAGNWDTRVLNPRYLTRRGRDAGFAAAAAACFGEFDLVQSHERIPGAAIYRAGDGVHATWLEQLDRTQGPLARAARRFSPYHRYVLDAEARMFRDPRLKRVICNARQVRDDIATRFGLPDETLTVIYNGVDTGVFHPDVAGCRAEQRVQWALPPDAPVLAYVGSGFERKGVATALSSIVPYPEVHLIVAGHDKHATQYRRQAEALGLASRVRFLGAVADVKRVYGAADALILPTLYDPFPNVCVEALACGLPLFTSARCGAAEWLTEGQNGWVRDALDIDGYASAIGSWLARRADWDALRLLARLTAEPYTLSHMAEQLQALYAGLLADIAQR